MCRSIHTLNNGDIPASEKEIQEAALQFVRKVSGYHHPSKANEAAFWAAVNEVSATTTRLLDNLETRARMRVRSPAIDIRSK
jgi:hypothetical protein